MATPTERILISDFSPGIFSRSVHRDLLRGAANESLGAEPTNGAATIDGTYGCIADSTGALIPLPARHLEESSPGVHPDAASHTFADDGLGANYLLDATLGEAVGDFGMPGEDSTPFGKHDVLIPQRAPYQTLYTTWNVTARDPDDPNQWTVATHGWYKIRQARVVEELGERHTFYWFSEQDQVWGDGDGGGTLPRMFNFASLITMRQHTWGKPDYGTRWPMFNPGTFTRAVIALVEGLRVLGTSNCGDCEPISAGVIDRYYYTDSLGSWFYPGGAFPTCSWPNPDFPWTTDSHMAILSNHNASYSSGNWLGVPLWKSYSGEAAGSAARGGWSAHFRDQSIASFFKSMPFRVRHAVHHQGRLVMISRREAGSTDEVLLYSDWLAPLNYSDETSDNTRRWGWDDKFFPPVSSDFPNIAVQWDVRNYRGSGAFEDAFYPAYTATRPYTVMLPGDDALANTCSMGTAPDGQLFLIKSSGGGVLMSGDLDNPTVRVNPNVEPTYGVESTGVHTPAGYVYGSRTGVYTWNGGDASQHLSPQLEGFFWDHATPEETDRYLGSRGRFEYWEGSIYAPNDYVYSMSSQGWWRLERHDYTPEGTPDYTEHIPYARYTTDDEGKLWAFSYKVTPENTNFAYTYIPGVPRDHYSWQSMPLLESDDHILSVQNIEALVIPTKGMNIVVTVTGYTYDTTHDNAATGHLGVSTTSRTVTFQPPSPTAYNHAVTNVQPLRLRADIPGNFNATQIQVRIEASGTTVAPRIHALSVGYNKRTRIPRLGQRSF